MYPQSVYGSDVCAYWSGLLKKGRLHEDKSHAGVSRCKCLAYVFRALQMSCRCILVANDDDYGVLSIPGFSSII